MSMRFNAICVALTVLSTTVLADVPDSCRVVYREAGAIPFEDQCVIRAASAGVDLGTYHCTARAEYVTEYCTSLPPYDEQEEEDGEDEEGDTGGSTDDEGGDSAGVDGGDGSDTSGGEGTGADGGQAASGDEEGSGDDQVSDGGGTDGGETGAEDPEFIIGGTGTTGEGGLPDYEETDAGVGGTGGGSSGGSDSSADCLPPGDLFPSSNGAFDFVVTQGWQFLNGPLSYYGNVATLLALANLGYSYEYAQETGDTSQVFANIYSILLPLFPDDSPIAVAFQDFSNLVDTLNGSECK